MSRIPIWLGVGVQDGQRYKYNTQNKYAERKQNYLLLHTYALLCVLHYILHVLQVVLNYCIICCTCNRSHCIRGGGEGASMISSSNLYYCKSTVKSKARSRARSRALYYRYNTLIHNTIYMQHTRQTE